MERMILREAPVYWDKNGNDSDIYELIRNSEEFRQIEFEAHNALNASLMISEILRNQNIHDFGQTLIREQFLACLNPNTQYFRVRRFVKLKGNYLNTAIDYNLDPRRCGINQLQLQSEISDFVYKGDILLVVQVITSNPNSSIITPTSSSDYFIDYIVKF